ncbi:MAG: hypothetical protein WAX89_05820 [Alphaproteobacteria bacterium]
MFISALQLQQMHHVSEDVSALCVDTKLRLAIRAELFAAIQEGRALRPVHITSAGDKKAPAKSYAGYVGSPLASVLLHDLRQAGYANPSLSRGHAQYSDPNEYFDMVLAWGVN